jgi:hypothetical protein
MALRDIVAQIIKRYPTPSELTKGRLTKIVYLVDWASAVRRGRSVTNINWEFNHYGPYVNDVIDLATGDHGFRVSNSKNAYGSDVSIISLRSDSGFQRLDTETTQIIDEVIKEVAPMNWSRFIGHVYETYPIQVVERYNSLPLADLAREMKRTRPMVER